MHARKRWLCCLAGTIAFGSSASAHDLSPKWTPWVEFGGFYGSNDSSRGEAVLWVPFAQGNTSLLFGEMRGKLFEDDMREGNLALGYRQMMPGGWNLGLWGGYDIRESAYGNTFHQLASGIEALSDRWDFRANAYLPLDDSETLFSASTFTPTSAPTLEFTGTSIGLMTTGFTTTTALQELALWGFDAEIGTRIFSTPLDLSGPRHELRVYAGAYHFDHSDLPTSVTGPRLRAEWRMDEVVDQWEGSRLTFEAEYSHDDLRDDRVEVGARLRLPFGAEGRPAYASRALTAQERRMSDGIERDTDIVTNTNTTSSTTASSINEAVEDAETGVRFDRVATIDATANLTTTSSNAGENSLIIADGTAGTINGVHALQGRQTLQGGGSTIQVRGVTSGIVVDFTAPGTRPHFFNAANSVLLSLNGSNTRVTSVDIENGGNDASFTNSNGIRILGRTNIHIDRVNIDKGRNGISDSALSMIAIRDVSISNVRDFAIAISWGTSATISDTTISGTLLRSGILVENGASAVISGTTIRNVAASGVNVYAGGTIDLRDSMIENAGENGINLVIGSTSLNVNNTTFAGTFGGSIIRTEAYFSGIHQLSGSGNIASGTTLGTGLCTTIGSTTGQVTLDIGSCP